jgi:hypothetical protein
MRVAVVHAPVAALAVTPASVTNAPVTALVRVTVTVAPAVARPLMAGVSLALMMSSVVIVLSEMAVAGKNELSMLAALAALTEDVKTPND